MRCASLCPNAYKQSCVCTHTTTNVRKYQHRYGAGTRASTHAQMHAHARIPACALKYEHERAWSCRTQNDAYADERKLAHAMCEGLR
mmetsp:Transcript_7269/g.15876  ORF Transcript_7269/g.15876 Transcript_7269/m.15876 type:complete len:87 (+) Transcript_7269:1-261(+)